MLHLLCGYNLFEFVVGACLYSNAFSLTLFFADNSDLIACTVVTKDGQKIRRFLVIDILQLILVEPDTRRLGWGVAKFVGFLQVSQSESWSHLGNQSHTLSGLYRTLRLLVTRTILGVYTSQFTDLSPPTLQTDFPYWQQSLFLMTISAAWQQNKGKLFLP